jgi:hypothetical protein
MRRALPLVIAILVTAPLASAEDVAGARAAFEQGASLASEGRWNDALAQFERSAAMRPHATTLYNLGFCERALGHPTRAKKYFNQALARDTVTSGTELTPELRAATARYLAEVSAQIATPHVTISTPDAKVSVDGRPLEPADDGERMLAGTRARGPGEGVPRASFVLELDAGSHEIVVTAPDGRSRVVHDDFDAGTTRELHLEIPALPPPAQRVEIVDRGAPRRTAGLVVGGVGLVALGVGGYFGWHARGLWNDAKDACPARSFCSSEDGARLSSSAKSYANLSTLAITIGGTALVGGIVLWATAPAPTTTTVGIGPGGITFRADF